MIAPKGHRILVKPDEVQKEFGEMGIVIAMDERMERGGMQTGTLVGIGDSAWKAFGPNFTGERWANEGDHVLYSRYAGKFVEDPENDELFLIMNDEDLLAVLSTGEENV